MKVLDSITHIRRYDRSGMLGLIDSFPEQCQDAKRIGYEFQLPEGFRTKYKNIVCAGVGGSAIGSDLVRSYIADDCKIPFFVNRNYTLPGFVDEDTLVIASSYSGNTEEVLSAYRDARSRGCEVIAITSGGKLLKTAGQDRIGVINLPTGIPPRAALGYSFFPLLILLSKLSAIKDQSALIDDAIRGLRKLKNSRLGFNIKEKDNKAKILAHSLFGKLPVVYGSIDHMEAVVTRWRGQLAENSKTLSSSHLFPEMSHNEIVGWENPAKVLKNSAVVMLRDAADHPRISRRMDIAKSMLKREGVSVTDINSYGKELLTRIFSLVYIGDYTSFYLAMLNEVDPYPVERIRQLKEELSR